MFLHLSVSHSVNRGSTWAGTPWAGTPPGQVHPWQVHPWQEPPSPGRYTPPGQVHPWAGTPPLVRYTPRQVHPHGRYTPGAVHAGRYGQQADGTHPTGMHCCLRLRSLFISLNSVFPVLPFLRQTNSQWPCDFVFNFIFHPLLLFKNILSPFFFKTETIFKHKSKVLHQHMLIQDVSYVQIYDHQYINDTDTVTKHIVYMKKQEKTSQFKLLQFQESYCWDCKL